MEELTRVMHVEDDDSIRMIASVALETVGQLQVLSCDGGQAAIQQINDFDPQVLLLDVMMPDMDGPTTLIKLREIQNLDNVLILFMTARIQDEEIENYLGQGAYDVIVKPFDPMTLADQIRQHWEAFSQSKLKG